MTSRHENTDWLAFDVAGEVERAVVRLRDILSHDLKRRGIVVGLSGGIDSSVTAALAVRAFGPTRVFGLLMPERQSDRDTLELSRSAANSLGIDSVHEDISGILEAV